MDEVSDPRVGFLRSDVERFCQQLDGLAPALRMRLLEELRSALVGALDEARVEAMAAASDEGEGCGGSGRFAGSRMSRCGAGREGPGCAAGQLMTVSRVVRRGRSLPAASSGESRKW